jgi:hypothetical protein
VVEEAGVPGEIINKKREKKAFTILFYIHWKSLHNSIFGIYFGPHLSQCTWNKGYKIQVGLLIPWSMHINWQWCWLRTML